VVFSCFTANLWAVFTTLGKSYDLIQYRVTSFVRCYHTGHTVALTNATVWPVQACETAYWCIAEMSLLCKFCLRLCWFKTVLTEFASILKRWLHDCTWPRM